MAEVFETDSRAGAEGPRPRRVARVYAEALLDVAEERQQADEIGQELGDLVNNVFNVAPESRRRSGPRWSSGPPRFRPWHAFKDKSATCCSTS